MKKLEMNQMECVTGGVSRGEYCGTLSSMFNGGGYQGDIGWFMDVFWNNCGSYGYTLW